MSRADFPIFTYHPDLVYLDTAATAQKPRVVIDAEKKFYEQQYATVHRGIYRLSQQSTSLFEGIREKVRDFLHAAASQEIIFTKGSTESINLVATCFALPRLQAGDNIIVSIAEHHANFVPWQEVCKKTGANLIAVPLLDSGEFDFAYYQTALNDRTKLVAVSHISNVLGLINPVEKIIAAAHAKHIPVLIDGAQAVSHRSVDVQALNCDFYVFSAHKLYGPPGVGVLYGKSAHLSRMPPYQYGGQMIRYVSCEKTEFADPPARFEAGTPNISGIVGLGAAIDYITQISFSAIQAHEAALSSTLLTKLRSFSGLRIYGDAPTKISVVSFTLDCAHPHDVATILDQSNIAVRAGHHCAMPLMHYLKVPALTRISLGIYNTETDIERLLIGLNKVRSLFV